MDGRCVDTLGAVNVVCSAIGIDGADMLRSSGGVVVAKVVADVVFDERVGSPSVQGKVRISPGVEATAVRNGPTTNVVG